MRSPVGGGRRTYPPSGLWIAAIGFFVTRCTVALAAFDDRVQFLVGGVVPLVLGLRLAAFGVVMLVGGAERTFVRSVAVCCTAGLSRVDVEVAVGRRVACVRIADDGPGLPEAQRATLERGSIADFDDPGAGFGTHVARLFVEGYGGTSAPR